ncbi:hypothetical protein [Sulfurihydrogenibium sp.]|uniref:hypothetical protein n=1 Tax=Sulfurihydrogenibium sp. TaxID=2053621 RepID=UPI002602ECA4|nr:hypothetical protein [Sulfurihydrogenibium sp.]
MEKYKHGVYRTEGNLHYFSDNLKKTLTKKLENLQIETKKFLQTKQLSEKLKEKVIENINPPSDEIVEEVKNSVELHTSTLEQKPDSFNIKLRAELSKNIESQIRDSTYLVLNEETSKINI